MTKQNQESVTEGLTLGVERSTDAGRQSRNSTSKDVTQAKSKRQDKPDEKRNGNQDGLQRTTRLAGGTKPNTRTITRRPVVGLGTERGVPLEQGYRKGLRVTYSKGRARRQTRGGGKEQHIRQPRDTEHPMVDGNRWSITEGRGTG